MNRVSTLLSRWAALLAALLLMPMSRVASQPPAPSTAGAAASEGVPAGWWAAVQAELRHAEYAVTWQDHTYLPDLPAAYQAPNRAENLRVYFGPAGPSVIPRVWAEDAAGPPWRWDLRLAAWGRAGDTPVSPAAPEVLDHRVEYRRGTLLEWYHNDEEGLALGWHLAAAEPGPAPLHLALEWGGGLAARAGDGAGVAFEHDGEVVLRLGETAALDAAGRRLDVRWSAGGGAITLVVDDAAAVYPIEVRARITGLPTLADWSLVWGTAGTQFGWSVSTAGDVNGDGYSDVIVGAPTYDHGQTDEGGIMLYLGHPLGLSYLYSWSKEGDQAGAGFGSSVGTAGDVNGDGCADVIAGAPGYNHPEVDEGGAWVYEGAPEDMDTVPDFFAQGDQAGAGLGGSVGTAGDVDADGYADVIVGGEHYAAPSSGEGAAWVWHGSENGVNGGTNGTPANARWHAEGNETGAMLGIGVGTAGDVDGDLYADVVVGVFNYGADDRGAALLWYGSANGVNNDVDGTPTNAGWLVSGEGNGFHLGRSVAAAGDVDGDGFADVIVGSPHYGNGQVEEGAAYLYLGSASGLDTTPANQDEGNVAGAWFGQSVAGAGDVNGDGYGDVVVGAPLYTNDQVEEGAAYLWYGSAAGISATRDWWAEGNSASAWFGNAVATAGDVNGDGYSDLIVGAPGENGEGGSASVYHGSADVPGETFDWAKRSNQEYAEFGASVSSAGDVNGDGYADIIVGSPLWDSDGVLNSGHAWLYRGAAGGLDPVPYWHHGGPHQDAFFGYAVSGAGDVDGDGYDDVIVGAPGYDHNLNNEGGAWVFHGSSAGMSDTASWEKESDQANAQFGAAVAGAGDVNGDGYGDVVVGAPFTDHGQTDEGVAWVYLGSAAGLNGVPAVHMEGDLADGQFGYAVAGAGDVNGDGCSDLVVGAPYWEDDSVNEGRAWLYLGSRAGPDPVVDWHAESNVPSARMGQAVAAAGDVNGDGYGDLVVSAPNYGDEGLSGEGKVWVFHGSAAGLSPTHAWYKESNENYAYYGQSVGTAGDADGDGYADLLIGAPGMDGPGAVPSAGAVRLYLGGPGGLGSSFAWTGESTQAHSSYGVSVSAAGDVNGDGYADLLIGAKDYDDPVTSEGLVFAYYGNGRSGAALALRQRNNAGAPVAHLGKTDGRSFRLALTQRSAFGRGEVMYEIEAKPLGVRFTGRDTFRPGGVWSSPVPGSSTTLYSGSLALGLPYHWRLRILYNPATTPWLPASRWVTIPWNGWQETDLWTQGTRVTLPLVLNDR